MLNRLAGHTLLILSVIFTAVVLVNFQSPLLAKVTGPCANCHTMHNSQNGGQVARPDSNTTTVGWGADGKLGGGSPQGAQSRLLVTNCVGCHSSTTSSTIIEVGGSKIPIVFNTGGYPENALAGGNFYWTSQGGTANDAKGHNVYGIAGQDSKLNAAPGGNMGCGPGSCHGSLARDPKSVYPYEYALGGCQGCHIFTSHHDDTRPWYRFLKGHGPGLDIPLSPYAIDASDYVLKTSSAPVGAPGDYISNEDPDWEATKSATDHNYYKGVKVAYTSGYNIQNNALIPQQSITAFCSGCHGGFHNTYDIKAGGAYKSPWLRHPTDVQLPDSGEYAEYNPVSSYSTEAPVAWVNPSTPSRSEAVVMCLSCHRAHGSDQPSMLRWDYSTMIVGTGSGSGGCFTCHTQKK